MMVRYAFLSAILLCFLAAAGPGAAHEETKGGITVSHPWARATPPKITTTAAYLEVVAGPDANDELVAAKSPAAGRVEIHRHTMENGIARMRRVESVSIPAGKSVVLAPSGYHIMLMDLKAPLKEGDVLPLTLVFKTAGEITVEAVVESPQAKGPHGFDHQPPHAGHGTHK